MKALIKETKSKAPRSLSKKEYFDWLEKAIDDAIFEAREFELDDIDDYLTCAREEMPDKSIREGIDVAMRILFQRRVQLRKDRGSKK